MCDNNTENEAISQVMHNRWLFLSFSNMLLSLTILCKKFQMFNYVPNAFLSVRDTYIIQRADLSHHTTYYHQYISRSYHERRQHLSWESLIRTRKFLLHGFVGEGGVALAVLHYESIQPLA